MTNWTLTYNGAEKALSAWGICADFSVVFSSKEESVVNFTTTEIFDAVTPQFPWMGAAILQRDRIIGTGGSFSGGTIYFQGYFGKPTRDVSGGTQHIRYQLHNAWWLMMRTAFKQVRKVWTGWIGGNPANGPVLANQVLTEIYLGENPDETYCTNGAQVAEVLNWIYQVYNPTWQANNAPTDPTKNVIQIGAIDPQLICPRTRVNSIFCAEAILNVLRWSPDCVLTWDYTQTPPVVAVKKLANLPTVTINLTANQEKQIKISPEYDRQLSGVVLYYKWVNTVDGTSALQIATDRYPLSTTDYQPEVYCATIELAGCQIMHVTAAVQTSPLSALTSGNTAAQLAWWQSCDQTLNDPSINPASIVLSAPVVTDTNGNIINQSTYPNILVGKSLPPWVPAQSIAAVITASITFNKFTDQTYSVQTSDVTRQIRQNVTLTNASTTVYSTISQFTAGEAPVNYNPTTGQFTNGLAQQIYTAVQTLQYSGTIQFADSQLRSDISIGSNVTLVGPNNTYANCQVQRIETQPHFGRTTVEFGPSSRLDAPALIELALATRWRTTYNMPSGRATGTAPGSQSVDVSASTPANNTQYGVEAHQFHAATYQNVPPTQGVIPSGQCTQVGFDAQAGGFVASMLGNDGHPVPGTASISALLSGLGGKAATWQSLTVCDSSGNKKTMLVLGTPPS